MALCGYGAAALHEALAGSGGDCTLRSPLLNRIPLSAAFFLRLPQVQLDGTVRTSGVGAPAWQQLVDDLPELGSVRTKLTDGVGL